MAKKKRPIDITVTRQFYSISKKTYHAWDEFTEDEREKIFEDNNLRFINSILAKDGLRADYNAG